MDITTKRKLLRLIASGSDTYAAIQKALPEIDHSDIYYLTFCPLEEERLLQEMNPKSRPRDEDYTFQPSDRFILTDQARDILSEDQRERRNLTLLYISTGASIIAALTGLLALLR